MSKDMSFDRAVDWIAESDNADVIDLETIARSATVRLVAYLMMDLTALDVAGLVRVERILSAPARRAAAKRA